MHIRRFGILLTLFLLASACATSPSAAPEAEPGPAGDEHSHAETIEVDADDAPSVGLTASKDTAGGWNLHMDVEGMQLAPENAGLAHRAGEGHMHLYVDGVKMARVYTPWFHLGDLEPGEHELRVTLNANSHADLTLAGEPISASIVIDQPAPGEAMHGHMDKTHPATTPMTVQLRVEADPKMGWNAFIETSEFEWAPEHASTEHVDGEGHAHIYVDGVKIARLYGGAFHFQYDQPGTHEVTVSLNGNDHAPYLSDGVPVEATAEIEIEGEPVDIDHTIDVAVDQGEVSGPHRVEVAKGDTVVIRVTSDTIDSVHVHGYDAYARTAPEAPAELTLTADIPGIFEVELEDADLALLELVVQ